MHYLRRHNVFMEDVGPNMDHPALTRMRETCGTRTETLCWGKRVDGDIILWSIRREEKFLSMGSSVITFY